MKSYFLGKMIYWEGFKVLLALTRFCLLCDFIDGVKKKNATFYIILDYHGALFWMKVGSFDFV